MPFLNRLLRKTSTEARLRAAEAKYRTLVEQLPLVTYIDALTASATSLYASPQVETLLGYSVDEWLGDPEFFPKLLHPDDRERILALVDHCNETAELFRAEYRLIARDGRTVWVQDESLVVIDEDGRPLFTQGYLLDITARKESSSDLRRSTRWRERSPSRRRSTKPRGKSFRSSVTRSAGRREGCGCSTESRTCSDPPPRRTAPDQPRRADP